MSRSSLKSGLPASSYAPVSPEFPQETSHSFDGSICADPQQNVSPTRSFLIVPMIFAVPASSSIRKRCALGWEPARSVRLLKTVIVLSGRTGGRLAAVLRETDVLINVPHDRAARVREVHALVLHCISDGVDAQLLGDQEIS